jgi:transcriptional regulator with PAS, ATPase and Fis domain
MIHANSPKADNKFIPVHAASIPGTLLESALFGHERGAFTGAYKNQPGFFEMAGNGTIFLDEIGEIDASTQVKLLRILQDGEYYRVGRSTPIHSKARVIGATHKYLKKLVRSGAFRQDLFYRLNIITLEIPPLRERREDIPILAKHFVQKFSKKHNIRGIYLLPETIKMLKKYDWPGNVRELENIIERLIALSDSDWVGVDQLPVEFFKSEPTRKDSDQFLPFAQAKALFERDYIIEALRRAQGNISQAARLAQMPRQNLYAKINKYGLKFTYQKMVDNLSEIDCLN